MTEGRVEEMQSPMCWIAGLRRLELRVDYAAHNVDGDLQPPFGINVQQEVLLQVINDAAGTAIGGYPPSPSYWITASPPYIHGQCQAQSSLNRQCSQWFDLQLGQDSYPFPTVVEVKLSFLEPEGWRAKRTGYNCRTSAFQAGKREGMCTIR